MRSDPSLFLKKIRYLSQALIISGLLNIALFLLIIYWIFSEGSYTPPLELKAVKVDQQLIALNSSKECSKVLNQFVGLSFSRLVGCLSMTQSVDNGCKERDLALSCMLSIHYFDLERALQGGVQNKQKRYLSGEYPFIVYVDLTDSDYEQIIHFATTELWPITAEGLFHLIKKGNTQNGQIDAFVLTREFWSVEQLFKRFNGVTQQDLLTLLFEGSWKSLNEFYENQSIVNHLVDDRRRSLLRNYLREGSPTAARLFVQYDRDFAVEMLPDEEVIHLIQKLPKNIIEGELYVRSVLKSPRSKKVWNQANEWLPPEKRGVIQISEQKREVPLRVISPPQKNRMQQVIVPLKNKSTSLPNREYIVQEKDSLWKVANRFKVSVEDLKKVNHLQSDAIKPGMKLRIPSHN